MLDIKRTTMNEVYNDVLGKALSIKSTYNIVVKVEQGALEVNLKQSSIKRIMWFSVFLIDGFTMRPCSYTFYSSMSDDGLDDTFTQVEGRLGFLKNLNSK